VTAGNGCYDRDTVQLFTDADVVVNITITSSSDTVCQGDPVSFSAHTANGGISPAFQWKVNGANVGTNDSIYTYVPFNGDIVNCILTSSEPCTVNNPATSNPVTMTVNENLPAGVIISANPNPFCQGTPVTFGATPLNGGSAPSYQWKVNGVNSGTDSPCFIYPPQPGDSVWCLMSSNLACVTGNPATSNRITMEQAPSPEVTFSRCFDSVTTVSAKPFQLKGGLPFCPPGWHIPSAADFQPLIDANQGNGLAGSFLTDLYLIPAGFEALLQGMAYLNTAWAFTSSDLPSGTMFWTSTQGSNNRIITRGVNSRNQSVSLYESSKANAFAVRCVKD